jgi:hypothetical protein
MQTELIKPGKLLSPSGRLAKIGWSRQPLLDCNLENLALSPWNALQRLRVKRWDYYAVFTPRRFLAFGIADLGYAGNVFAYMLDFVTQLFHEESLVVSPGKNLQLPRNSHEGNAAFQRQSVRLDFQVEADGRNLAISWPDFQGGVGLQAEIFLACPPDLESMNLIVPMHRRRFYFNRKINCMPAEGFLRYGDVYEELAPHKCSGSLDWGRGIWPYNTFWNWASASGFLPDGRTFGLNLGAGFGDTSVATENCLILEGRVHKLEQVSFQYDSKNYNRPWKFSDSQGRLSLEFKPFKERIARSNLLVVFSEVHQLFGYFSGSVTSDDGEIIPLVDLVGFAEEHHARW